MKVRRSSFQEVNVWVRILTSFLAVSLWETTCWGAAEVIDARRDYDVAYWKVTTGYPAPTVRDFAQLEDGRIVALTDFALVEIEREKCRRIDGPEFQIGTQNDEVMAVDLEENIWVATANGLYRWSSSGFELLTESEGLFDDEIMSVASDLLIGGVWVSTIGGINHVSELGDAKKLWPDAGFNSMHWWSESTFVGVGKFDFFVSIINDRLDWSEFETTEFPGPNGAILGVEIWNGTLFTLSGTGLYGRKIDGDWNEIASLEMVEAPYLSFLFRDSKGQFWTHGGQSEIQRIRGQQVTRVKLPLDDPKDWPVCMFEDREGGLWVGLQYSGIVRLQPHRVTTFSDAEGLIQRSAWTVLQSSKGGVWVGTNGGVTQCKATKITARIGSGDGSKERALQDFGEIRIREEVSYQGVDGVFDGFVRAMAEDRSEDLWIETSGGLVRLRDGKLEKLETREFKSGNGVRAICPNGGSGLWLGNQSGLFLLETSHAALGLYGPYIAGVSVKVLHYSDSGDLWVGTDEQGILRLTLADGRQKPSHSGLVEAGWQHSIDSRSNAGLTYQSFPATHGITVTRFGPESGVPVSKIWAIHEDALGSVWFAGSAGLIRYRNEEFSVFDRRHGLLEDEVNCVLTDAKSDVWISGDQGIYWIERNAFDIQEDGTLDLAPIKFGEHDGMRSPRTGGGKSSPSGCRSEDGLLWFPTDDGVSVIDPEHAVQNLKPPPAFIETVRAGEELAFSRSGDRASFSRRDGRHLDLELRPGGGLLLEITFRAWSYRRDPIRYKYRIFGIDDDWKDGGTTRTAYYTRIPPGEYTFELMTGNSNGVWNSSCEQLTLSIPPTLYEASWFRIGAAVFSLGVVILVVRFRIRRVREIESLRNQLKVEMERTRIARDLHDEIGPRLTELALVLDPSPIQDEIGKSAVAQAGQIAGELADSVDGSVWAVRPQSDSLEHFGAYVSDYAHRLILRTNIQLTVDYPSAFPKIRLRGEERHQLFLISREAIHNVVRHSGAKNLLLSLRAEADELILRIEDDGCGLSVDEVAKSAGLRNSTGLDGMRERGNRIGAELVIDSTPNQGTVVQTRFRVCPETSHQGTLGG